MSVPKITEREMQTAIVRMAKQLGYLVYHAAYSIGSEKGFPDLTIVGHGRMWMLELKGPKGRVSGEQEAWIAQLQLAGVDALIVWPDDLDMVLTDLMEMYERRHAA
jgi:hypothetical protein